MAVSPVSRISFKYLTKMEAQRYPSLAKGDNFGIPNVKYNSCSLKALLELSILMLENGRDIHIFESYRIIVQ